MKPIAARFLLVVVTTCAISLLTLSVAQAASDIMWCDGMAALLRGYHSSVPTYDFGPYFQKEAMLRAATARGDEAAARAYISEVITMVRTSDIDEDVAAELLNYLRVWQSTYTPHVNYVRSR